LWNDQRTGAECAEIEKAFGGRTNWCGWWGSGADGVTLPKILWVRRHEPEVFARVASIVMPKDFIRLKLTGELATDVGDASGTLLFDVEKRAWSAAAILKMGLDEGLLPRAVESAR